MPESQQKTTECRPNLGAELFALVQADQGYAFISDAVEDMSAREVVEIARISLEKTNRSAAKLRRFLKTHGHLAPQ